MAAHQLPDVTIVAAAGMISAGNKQAIEAARLSCILGTRIPDLPYVVTEWRKTVPTRRTWEKCDISTLPRTTDASWASVSGVPMMGR